MFLFICGWNFSHVLGFFFFKQKTAYEMRISDWSSDVCSSDLHPAAGGAPGRHAAPDRPPAIRRGAAVASDRKRERHPRPASRRAGHRPAPAAAHARDPGGGTRAMNQQADISREGDFYVPAFEVRVRGRRRSEEHTSELQSLMRISSAVFCLK